MLERRNFSHLLYRNGGPLTDMMHPHFRWFGVLSLAALMHAQPPAVLAHSAGTSSKSTEVVRLPGLRQPVEILLDRWGVPRIFAENESDLFFAQGYNAARDRLFQLDLWRRRGLGRLAEVIGPGFVEQDRAARLFLYRGDIEREWRAYSSKNTMEAAHIAGAFAAGINAYIDYVIAHPAKMPWEFRHLGYEPSKWAPDPARRIVRLLESLVADEAKTRAGIELLKGWDFRESQESAPAALFEVWQARHLRRAFRSVVLPEALADALLSADERVMIATLENPAARFTGNATLRRNKLLLETLAGAYAEREKLQGPDPRLWQWGKLQQNFVQHPLSSLVDEARRRKINVGPLPRQGGEYTPNQSGYRTEDFRQTSGPSFRIIVDVGNWDNSRAVNHPGQSGNPDSPHYRDLAPLWLRGEYFPLLHSRKAIEQAAEARIRLVPQGQAPRKPGEGDRR